MEGGDFPVDVIFSRAGDPFLSRYVFHLYLYLYLYLCCCALLLMLNRRIPCDRLPKDIDIETLDFAWINASLQAGKLCEVAPFRLSIASCE